MQFKHSYERMRRSFNDPGLGAILAAMPYTCRRTWPDTDRENHISRLASVVLVL